MTNQMSISILLPVANNVVNQESVPTVDMRKVHAWLGVKSKYADWINRRISEYSFENNIDYIRILNSEKAENTNITTKDYHATLEMAKEICMVERNEKGREARKYFIECEKVAKQQVKSLPTDYITALEALVVSEKEKEALRLENQSQATKIEVDRPKVDFYHQLFSENPLVSFNDYAKLLSKETGVKIGQNNLMKFLRESGYLMVGRAGSKSNERNKAYQKYITAGYFEIEYNKTPVGLKPQTFITAKGQIELAEMIVNHFTK